MNLHIHLSFERVAAHLLTYASKPCYSADIHPSLMNRGFSLMHIISLMHRM